MHAYSALRPLVGTLREYNLRTLFVLSHFYWSDHCEKTSVFKGATHGQQLPAIPS